MLYKCNAAGRFWRARYVVVTTDTLLYFASRADAERELRSSPRAGARAVVTRKGGLPLEAGHTAVAARTINGAPTAYTFVLAEPGGRPYIFAAGSEAAFLNWLGAIATVLGTDVAEVLADGGEGFADMVVAVDAAVEEELAQGEEAGGAAADAEPAEDELLDEDAQPLWVEGDEDDFEDADEEGRDVLSPLAYRRR